MKKLNDKVLFLRSVNLRIVLLACALALLMAGCAIVPVPTRSEHTGQNGPVGVCADFFASLDRQTRVAEAIDSGVFRVKHYPYLRVNRFVASFGGKVDHPAAFEAWVDRMQALDRDARQHEIANLPEETVDRLDPVSGRAGLIQKVAVCGDLLRSHDFKAAEQNQQVSERVTVPDDYILFHRVLGLYPLTSLFVSSGVSKWHAEARQHFSNKAPTNWQTVRYAPEENIDWQALRQGMGPIARDALGIPVYSQDQQQALFKMYAPVWEVQIEGDHDRIGTPFRNADGLPGVDTARPRTYTHLSFTRFNDQIMTQLNYIIWFPARPKKGELDIYGGLLDGVNYRVTLDADHRPLLYETVHNCGCYYKAYPTKRLAVRSDINYAEPPLILPAPDIEHNQHHIVFGMQTGTHYVQHMYAVSRVKTPEAVAYQFEDYSRLRSIAAAGGVRRSFFDQNGLVSGSERLERFILWPTGVVSPGGMRQWGRHAVAFVGRRHFDDADYMDIMFVKIQ